MYIIKQRSFWPLSGLDPAGPLFQSFGEPIYLDRNDAIFVDIIHSNGLPGGAGTFISHGHVDFFSNGGAHQPGCAAREDLINTERVKRPSSQNKVVFCVPLFLFKFAFQAHFRYMARIEVFCLFLFLCKFTFQGYFGYLAKKVVLYLPFFLYKFTFEGYFGYLAP